MVDHIESSFILKNRDALQPGVGERGLGSVKTVVIPIPALSRRKRDTTVLRFGRVFLNLMKSTLVQQGPRGAPWGVPVFTLHLNSDAGYADLPLTLLGAPVNIGEARGDVLWPKPRLYCLSPSPGTYVTPACTYLLGAACQ